jgi:hypothetical protein
MILGTVLLGTSHAKNYIGLGLDCRGGAEAQEWTGTRRYRYNTGPRRGNAVAKWGVEGNYVRVWLIVERVILTMADVL